MEIKYEALKVRARKVFIDMMQNWPYNADAYVLLLAFLTMTKNQRDELRAFANEFDAHQYDYLAHEAKSDDNRFAQMILKARETGLSLIEKWDVRQVKKLIEAFPSIVATQYRNAQITADLVENDSGEDCDWIVSFDKSNTVQAN